MLYDIWLSDPNGTRIAYLDTILSFSYTRALNTPGAWTLTLPDTFDPALAKVDARIEIWRRPDESLPPRLEMVGLLRKPTYSTNESGVFTVTLSGPDMLDVLRRRIVAYPGTDTASQSNKCGPADDVIKAIVRENLGAAATVAARDLSALGFYVAADQGLGPTIAKQFSWRKVTDVIREICDAAAAKGTPVYYDYEYLSEKVFEFRTYVGYRGRDRSLTSAAPVVIGLDFGTLGSPTLEEDSTAEINHVYARGVDSTTSALILVEVEDAKRMTISPLNRCEGFVEAMEQTTNQGVTDQANTLLKDGRARTKFGGNLIPGPGAVYGLDWGFGDRVVANYIGRQFDVTIKALTIAVDANGKETFTARLEAET